MGSFRIFELSDLIIWYDKQSLYKICESQLKIESPVFFDINELIQKMKITKSYLNNELIKNVKKII